MRLLLLAATLLAASPVVAQQQSSADPEKQALAYQLQQCRQAGDQTATGAFTVASKLEAETKRADGEKKRADEAEAKLKAEPKPAEAK